MTVQELIDALLAVEDKTIPVVIRYGEFDDDIEADMAEVSTWENGYYMFKPKTEPCFRVDLKY